MTLGTLLVILAVIMAIASFFVATYAHRLVAGAVVLMGIGVLIGVGNLSV